MKHKVGRTLVALLAAGVIIFWPSGSVEKEPQKLDSSRKNSVSLLRHQPIRENTPSWAKFSYDRKFGEGFSLGLEMQYVDGNRSFLSSEGYITKAQFKQSVPVGPLTYFVGLDLPLFRYGESLKFDLKKGVSENLGISLGLSKDKSLSFKLAHKSDNTYSGTVELKHKF